MIDGSSLLGLLVESMDGSSLPTSVGLIDSSSILGLLVGSFDGSSLLSLVGSIDGPMLFVFGSYVVVVEDDEDVDVNIGE